jgi:type IV pilus assembly protein PilN
VKINVNLASHPYLELGPVYNRLRTWMAILAVLGLALWFLYRGERSQAQDTMARVASVQNHVKQLEQQRQSYQTLMQQPKDAAILNQSDFLNDLFREKAFSWTATMTDLETVLPSGVEVLSIDPIVAKDGHVTIRLRVTGARDRALDLVRNLEKSKHFAQPRLAAESQANAAAQPGSFQNVSASSEVDFDILADYRPLPMPTNASGEEEKPTEAEKPGEAKKPVEANKPGEGKKPGEGRKPAHAAKPTGQKAPMPPGIPANGGAKHP